MLRLIHTQTVPSAIVVDDIDDGLPNKTAHRLGSTADPNAYARDGYANYPKQPCYVPYTSRANPLVAGYIDLNLTQRVTLSAGKGKISKLKQAGLLTSVLFNASDLATPVVGLADLDTPGVGDLTITGSGFDSLAPNQSSVVITGTGAITLTRSQILVGGGTFADGAIFIPAVLFTVPLALATSFAKVVADLQNSNVLVLT